MDRSPTITLVRGRRGPAAAQVFDQVRAAGLASRDEIVSRTGLSPATVGRTVGQLVEAALLRERPDRVRSGVAGRPGIPVEIDPTVYVTLGVHLGRRIATVALGDLTGRVLAQQTVRRPPGVAPDLDELSRLAAGLLGGQPSRAPLSVGLVAPWREIDLDPRAAVTQLHELTGLDVRSGDHIAAVAATEFLHRRQGTPGITLYVYARDSLGFAAAVDRGGSTEVSRVASLTHFPSGAGVRCPCGRTGCLAAAASDDALLHRARAAGLVEDGSTIDALYAAVDSPAVLNLLAGRARLLGEAAAAARDMLSPDRVVLVGQAFTGCRAVLGDVIEAFEAATALGPVPVSFTRFGAGIQAAAACTVGLMPVRDDPLGLASGIAPRRSA